MRAFYYLFFLGVSFATAQDWPQFRGPNQDGTSDARNAPTHWSETENISWSREIPGKGWSSPVISNGKVWLTTAVEVEATEAERVKLLAGIEPRKVKSTRVASAIEVDLIKVDLATGVIEEKIVLLRDSHPDSIHKLNSYASPTPVIDGSLIYCDFGSFGTIAVERQSGKVKWECQFEIIHSVGPGSSPMIAGDLLILVRDGVDTQYVIALDKKTGETRWKTERPPMDASSGEQKKAYSTPLLIEHNGSKQLVIPTSQWIVSYVPETGKEIWRARHGKGFSLVPRPVYGHGLVFFCTGFGKPHLWAVRPDGKGDVTDTHLTWTATKAISQKPSPLLVDDYLYILNDGGIVSCYDSKTGKLIWMERVTGNYSASPMYADGHIYLCSHEGDTRVLKHGDIFIEVANNKLEGAIMASPVPINGGLLIRDESKLYRIGL